MPKAGGRVRPGPPMTADNYAFSYLTERSGKAADFSGVPPSCVLNADRSKWSTVAPGRTQGWRQRILLARDS